MARIQTTPMVRLALWALRIYLLILLTLIGFKFARVFSKSHQEDRVPSSPSTVAVATNQTPVNAKP